MSQIPNALGSGHRSMKYVQEAVSGRWGNILQMFHTETSRATVGVVDTAVPFPRQSTPVFILTVQDIAYDPVVSDYENKALASGEIICPDHRKVSIGAILRNHGLCLVSENFFGFVRLPSTWNTLLRDNWRTVSLRDTMKLLSCGGRASHV